MKTYMFSFVYLKVFSMNFISFAMNSAQSVSLEANFPASVFTVTLPELHFRPTRHLNWQHGRVSTIVHLLTITLLVLSAGFAELQHGNALDPWIPVQRIKITILMYTLYSQTTIPYKAFERICLSDVDSCCGREVWRKSGPPS